MSNFIFAPASGYLQNRLHMVAKASVDHIDMCNVSFEAVIDTGCAYTKLSALNIMGPKASQLLEQDLNNYRNKMVDLKLSYGVNDNTRIRELDSLTLDELRSDQRIGFGHKLVNFSLGDYVLNRSDLGCKVTYRQSGVSLIGMNILNQMDFHCGFSRVLKKFVFIGCLRSDISIDYLKALAEHLGYLPNTSFIKYLIKNGFIDEEDLFIRKNYDLTK